MGWNHQLVQVITPLLPVLICRISPVLGNLFLSFSPSEAKLEDHAEDCVIGWMEGLFFGPVRWSKWPKNVMGMVLFLEITIQDMIFIAM